MERQQFRKLVCAIVHALTRTEYSGLEHLPEAGGIIVATNHISQMDTAVLLCNPRRPDITALIGDSYRKYPFFNWVVESAGAIWLDRKNADFTAVKLAGEALQAGKALGIAPEGTRSKVVGLLEGKQGTALIALKYNVPIVPVGISGTYKSVYRAFTLRQPRIQVRFGPPLMPAVLPDETKSQAVARLTEDMMLRLAALLPEELRGFYRDHPGLANAIALTEAAGPAA